MQNDQTAEIQNAEISFAKDSEIQKFGKTFQLILCPVFQSGLKMNGELCTNSEIQNDQNTQITNNKMTKFRNGELRQTRLLPSVARNTAD